MAYEEDRQSALTRALIMGGAAMTQPGAGGFMGALGRGGMMGLNAYDNTFQEMTRRRVQAEAERRMALQSKLDEIDLARRQALSGIFNDFSGASSAAPVRSGPAMGEAPDWKSNPMNAGAPNAAPSVKAPQGGGQDPAEQLIRRLAAGGFPSEAKAQLEIFKGLEGEVYGDPQVDKDGRVFVNTKRGPKYVSGGFVPRDKLVETDVGDRKVFRTEFDLTPRGEYKKGMSPDAAAANALGWANYYKPELRDSGTGVVATSPDGKGGVRVIPTDIPRKAERLTSGDADKLMQLDELAAKAKWAAEGVRKNPDAVGPENALLPSWALNMGKTANVDTRARLAELSTFVLNARSGAAVTEHEYKRLEPFLATPNDTAKSAQTKLSNLIKTMEGIREGRTKFYASQGYNVPASQFGQGGVAQESSSGLPGNMSPADLAAAIKAELAKRGGK